MYRKTTFSVCRTWRYTLWRELDFTNKTFMVIIGLNPSTADELRNDPTIRRCIAFAKAFGFGSLCMLNLFAYRSTDPKVMRMAHDPIGPDNDRYISEITANADIVIAAWGANGTHIGRGNAVKNLIRQPLYCLGRTKDGYPAHPLYLPKASQLILL